MPRFSLLVGVGFLFALVGCERAKNPEVTIAEDPKPAPEETAAPAEVSGREVYLQHCAVCHMDDGSGVPNMQPPLIDSPIVAGEPAKLEAVIRGGSAALRDRPSEYAEEMPPFGMLTRDEVEAVMDFVRREFGNRAVE